MSHHWIVAGLILNLSAAPVFAQDATALYMQAVAAYEAKDYAKSIELGLASLEKGAKTGTVPYHLACCYALTNQSDDAFKYLNLSIERGWRNLEHMQADADLNSLHADKRWEAAVKACEAAREKYFKTLGNPELAKELLRRMAEDQKMRFKFEERMRQQAAERQAKAQAGQESEKDNKEPQHSVLLSPADLHEFERVDKENTAWLKQVVEKHGWPGKSMVGEDGAQAAWLLVQHADLSADFQQRCLELIKEAFKKGEVTGQQVAYLTDRVLVKEGKKQVYGTQFREQNGEMQPFPIEDEANVDARRKEVGLGSLADYAKQMKGRG